MRFDPAPRRVFLAGLAGVAALVRPLTASAFTGASDPDQWLDGLTGKYRQLFDFNAHGDGIGFIHMHNFIETLKSAYGARPSDISVVGTFYGATTPLAWNDVMWAKYRIGTALNLIDPETKTGVTRNWFFQPKKTDPVFLNGAVAEASIDNLRARGATFLMCNNAFQRWTGRLAGQGFGQAADIAADIKANLISGVVTVPAMVIAIGAAQRRGLTYMRT